MVRIESGAGPGPDELLVVWAYAAFHLSGEAEKYEVGRFVSCEEALAACRAVVDEFLESAFEDGMSPDELRAAYEASGPDPYIEPREAGCVFEARRYASEQARVVVGEP